MEWENLIGNIIFIIVGIFTILYLDELEGQRESVYYGINKFVAYIMLLSGVLNFIVLLYKIVKYLFC